MYNRDQFLDNDAKNSLENHRREQEMRKATMLRQQRERDLKQLETQLFYKNQEVERLKSLFGRLKREAVLKQDAQLREKRELLNHENQIKETEDRVHKLDSDVNKAIADIADKIAQEKATIIEHQRILDNLEREKRGADIKKESDKKTLVQSVSRLLFMKKREEHESQGAEKAFKNNQAEIEQVEKTLKSFTQETNVLENKIKALHSSIESINRQ